MEVLIIIAVLVAAAAYAMSHRRESKLCTACGTVDRPVMKSTASVGIGLFMWIGGIALALMVHWLFLLMPIGHLLAQLGNSGVEACPKCGSTSVVPLDTPVAQRFIRDAGEPKN